MNTRILQKCVDALKQESPDLSYVRGMLETLIDIDVKDVPVKVETVPAQPITSPITHTHVGEPIEPGFKEFVAASLTTE